MTETYDFETANFMRHGPARKNVIRIAVGIIAPLLFFFLSPFGTIAAGERGVHLRFTAVTGKVFGEGLYFRFPLIESVQMMDVVEMSLGHTANRPPNLTLRQIRRSL